MVGSPPRNQALTLKHMKKHMYLIFKMPQKTVYAFVRFWTPRSNHKILFWVAPSNSCFATTNTQRKAHSILYMFRRFVYVIAEFRVLRSKRKPLFSVATQKYQPCHQNRNIQMYLALQILKTNQPCAR